MGSFPHVPWLEQVKLGIRDLSYLLQQVWKHQVWGRTDWTSTRQCTSCGWDCFWPFWDEPEPFNLNHTKHWGGVCFFLLFTGSPFAEISKKFSPFLFPPLHFFFSSFVLIFFSFTIFFSSIGAVAFSSSFFCLFYYCYFLIIIFLFCLCYRFFFLSFFFSFLLLL
jgi:hypothetical protein